MTTTVQLPATDYNKRDKSDHDNGYIVKEEIKPQSFFIP